MNMKGLLRALTDLRRTKLGDLGLRFFVMGIIGLLLCVTIGNSISYAISKSVLVPYLIATFMMALTVFGLLLIMTSRDRRSTQQAKGRTPRVSKAPGSGLLAVVEYLYSPKTVEGVFKPIIADWRKEYFEALKDGRDRKASWINVRYIFSFGMAMGLSKILSVVRSIAHR